MTAVTTRRGLRRLSPDRLLFRKYKLNRQQKFEMIFAGLVLSQLASPVGSAIYFLVTQVSYQAKYKNTVTTLWYLRDTWNRLPVHVENVLHAHWFTGQAAPSWWVTARHDARHVLIGFLITLMVSALTVGLRERKRASGRYMLASIPVALLVAAPVAAGAILFFVKIFPQLSRVGFVAGFPWLTEWLGKGSIQLTITGILAGFPARRVLARTMDTLQLVSLEKKLASNATPRWWWRWVYLPNYRNRYAYLKAADHQPEHHGKTLGVVIALASPVFFFLLGFGIWLLYFGPAKGHF
jgi:hypothetical protein